MAFTLVVSCLALFLLFYGALPTGLLLSLLAAAGLLLFMFLRRHRHSHGGFLSLDHYAQSSRLRVVHPGLKLLGAVSFIVICLAANSLWLCALVVASMFLYTVLVGGTPASYYISLLALPLAFIALSALAVLLQFGHQPLGLLDIPLFGFYASVTRETQHTALHMAAKALAGVSCLYMLSLSTPMGQIIATLRKARLPAIVIELMYLIYRYIFVLLRVQSDLSNAAASRLGYHSGRATLKTALRIAAGLAQTSFAKASAHFDAMEARCCDGQIRFLQRQTPLRVGDALLFLGYGAALCGLGVLL